MLGTVLDLSPQKRLLNFEEFTPAKIMVGCEINGWFETHKKSPIIQRKKPPRYIHSRFNADKKIKQINKFNQSPFKANLLSITKLKCQMDALSTKCQLQAMSTNCKSTETNSTQGKNKNQMPVLNVNISSFQQLINKADQQKRPIKPVQHFFNIREIKTGQFNNNASGSITHRMQQRKKRINKILSCNKIKTKQKQQIQNHIAKKIFLINRSVEIINGDLSTNQKRALNMIVSQKHSIKIENLAQSINQNKSSSYERYRNKPITDKFA